MCVLYGVKVSSLDPHVQDLTSAPQSCGHTNLFPIARKLQFTYWFQKYISCYLLFVIFCLFSKLDGVGSVDNRPSTNYLQHFARKTNKQKQHMTPYT